MPLTKKGKDILKDLKSQYGDYKGERIFYGCIKNTPEDTMDWHDDDYVNYHYLISNEI